MLLARQPSGLLGESAGAGVRPLAGSSVCWGESRSIPSPLAMGPLAYQAGRTPVRYSLLSRTMASLGDTTGDRWTRPVHLPLPSRAVICDPSAVILCGLAVAAGGTVGKVPGGGLPVCRCCDLRLFLSPLIRPRCPGLAGTHVLLGLAAELAWLQLALSEPIRPIAIPALTPAPFAIRAVILHQTRYCVSGSSFFISLSLL